MKKVRILLRVSSNQQLDADGDLNVQRELIQDYVKEHDDWVLDDKEYFEGGISGYKNSVKDREALQDALNDAMHKEYDILAVYKDDRIGRRMWESGPYIMKLKEYGVDTYSVKDGLITPKSDDIMGQMVLALRYGNAQKSSSDTGMRVKDTAQKLVQQGKFMGGAAPYGYQLVYSGEISKHGRALKKLQIVPEQAEVVKHIYELSLYKEYGSSKIARILNEDDYYKTTAPKDVWKAGTITSIITNPIYAGLTAYKRREKTNGKYHRLDSDDWIYAKEINPDIAIIAVEDWNEVQRKRKLRSNASKEKSRLEESNIIKENKGSLALIDVLYCGYCGHKLTNGTKYNYWTLKNGEKRGSKYSIYKCQLQWAGVLHDGNSQYNAEDVEKVVFEKISEYIEQLQDNTEIFSEITQNNQKQKEDAEKRIKEAKKELEKIESGINVMKQHLPDAIMGNYAVNAEILSSSIEMHEKMRVEKENDVKELQKEYENMGVTTEDWDQICELIPKWRDVFFNADKSTQRVLINRIVERITITKENIVIKFKIELPKIQEESPRIGGVPPTIPCKHDSE